jgi:hypothetical protein
VNKFEALKQFQDWPPDWQRLCAEYWIEMGDVDPKFVLAMPKKAEKTPPESVSTMTKDLWPFDQPKAAKVAKKPLRNGMRYSRAEVSEVDSHLSEGRSCYETAKIMDRKYPNQRTKHAWKQLADRIRGLGFAVMIDRAVDVEFK